MTFLNVSSLNVSYTQNKKSVAVIKDLHLLLPQGEIGVLIGPSGCGKSTLLNVIAGLNTDYQGSVMIRGRIPKDSQETALILQDYGLLPWKTVWDNVKLGLQIKGVPKDQIAQKTEAVLIRMGLQDYKKRYPVQLSGGQKQRIAIARSLILDPGLLLMDEPFSSLDALTREEMQDILRQIWQETKLTILLITHNIEEAVFLGHKIYIMSTCPGNVLKTVNNKMAGDYSARGKVEFMERCNQLRSYLRGDKQCLG